MIITRVDNSIDIIRKLFNSEGQTYHLMIEYDSIDSYVTDYRVISESYVTDYISNNTDRLIIKRDDMWIDLSNDYNIVLFTTALLDKSVKDKSTSLSDESISNMLKRAVLEQLIKLSRYDISLDLSLSLKAYVDKHLNGTDIL